MQVLFLSYWSADDPLNRATTWPHLSLLMDNPAVAHVTYVTVERESGPPIVHPFGRERFEWRPLRAQHLGPRVWKRALDFVLFPRVLEQWVRSASIDVMVARGAPAGSLASLLHRKLGVPYWVESFEPHAEYMLASGVWPAWDPRYLFQRRWEERQKREAVALLPVTDAYRQALLDEGLAADRVRTVPCGVPLERFAFDPAARARVRREIGFSEQDLVGVYLGKFGGLYYDQEAFGVFARAAAHFGKAFRLLVLTPTEQSTVRARLRGVGLDEHQAHVAHVAHDEVPHYLSASDFGFATIKPTPAQRYSSAIKIGEYWANGLPVLLTEGVGDEAHLIPEQGGGALFRLDEAGSLTRAFGSLAAMLARPHETRREVARLAAKYRSFDRAREAYAHLLRTLAKSPPESDLDQARAIDRSQPRLAGRPESTPR